MKNNFDQIPKIKNLNSKNFLMISGPCVIEGEDMALRIGEKLATLADKYKIPYVFKGSFRKANRTKKDSFEGIGDLKALKILRKVSETFSVPTLTDIHKETDANLAAEYVDILQIPAFLVRQTDLILAASKTGKYVNLKKGQFMSPESMYHAVNKVKHSGNDHVFLTERGSMFGYQDLIIDFRGIPTMKQYAPVILDITHSLQQPNQISGITGGLPYQISTVAKAGIAVGVDGLFMETHFDPKNAKSDGANMINIKEVEILIKKLVLLQKACNEII